jgi:hypothetical protein
LIDVAEFQAVFDKAYTENMKVKWGDAEGEAKKEEEPKKEEAGEKVEAQVETKVEDAEKKTE